MKKTVAVALIAVLLAMVPMPSHASEVFNLRVCAENNEVRATIFGKDGKLIPQPTIDKKYVENGKMYARVTFDILWVIPIATATRVPVVTCGRKKVDNVNIRSLEMTSKIMKTLSKATVPTKRK